MIKRIFDILASAVGLLLLWPLMLIIAILIMRSSKGGALFVQDRVGLHENRFACYKFRTMAKDTPLAASHDVSSVWITPIGKFLRKTKLDELPQLYNVIKGDMSLVGPRPCLPNQLEVIEARRYKGVYDVRPGITGPAQLARVDMSTPEKLAQVDHQYILNRSFLEDLTIIFSSVLGVGSGDAIKP